jgi:anti-sigma factor RsiW
MTMKCNDVRESLAEYADGLLEWEESDRIRRHLSACPSCRSALEAERRLLRDLSSLPRPRCPDRIAESVMRRVSAANAPWWKSLLPGHWKLKPAFAVALVIALMLGLGELTRVPRHRKPAYSEAEIELAGTAFKWSLAFTAHTIRESEKQALAVVLAEPAAGNLIKPASLKPGGNKR